MITQSRISIKNIPNSSPLQTHTKSEGLLKQLYTYTTNTKHETNPKAKQNVPKVCTGIEACRSSGHPSASAEKTTERIKTGNWKQGLITGSPILKDGAIGLQEQWRPIHHFNEDPQDDIPPLL
eukprot:TRINITY_DN15724_c0_g1_i1.p1 TRINITY_DN15724_c0_g1~~TRINITY_DN15724_c0_g1_i1.p1  ORF type:complete len:123 (+),score=1.68 TRINITY_DN15724_c0_g1_i1:590-958(+)